MSSVSLGVSLADPQSAKQTNVVLIYERNEHSNAMFEEGKLSVSLSVSLADPQSAKQPNVILMKEMDNQMQDSNAKN